VDAWCRLISVADGEMSQDGQSAAKLLLSHQTPASIVPLNEVTQPEEPLAPQTAETGVSTKSSDQAGETPRDEEPGQVSMLQDASQPEGGRLWFRWTPAQLVAWYNERTSLDELLPDERNGYGLASWRGERTASVAKRGNRWTDFGAGARRADGTQDSGDAFELRVRLSGKPKGQVMSEAGRELAEVARVALESAARSDQPLPAWLEEIITDAGWQRYQEVAVQAGHRVGVAEIRENRHEPVFRNDDQGQAETSTNQIDVSDEQAGGVSAFSVGQGVADASGDRSFFESERGCLQEQSSELVSGGPVSLPSRPTLCCHSLVWKWNPEREIYDCGACGMFSGREVSNDEQGHRGDVGEAVASSVLEEIGKLEVIESYAEGREWVALVVDGVEVVPEGRSAWLRFVWLSGEKEKQRQVLEYLSRT